MYRVRKEAERILEKHRTKHCKRQHFGACRPHDLHPTFAVGDKVCKATLSNNDNVQVWCVVATAKASKCFRFAPHFSSTEHCDTCIVIAPLSAIDGGNILDKQRWIVKFDQNLLRRAPKYVRGEMIPTLSNGSVEELRVILKYDWTYLGLHTGWIYQVEGTPEWVTESYLDSLREDSRQRSTTQKPVAADIMASNSPDMTATAPVAKVKKMSEKKEAMKRANALEKSQKSKILTLKGHVKRLNKKLRKQQLARLKEQVNNYNLRVRIKAMKEDVRLMTIEKQETLADQSRVAENRTRRQRRRARKHKV